MCNMYNTSFAIIHHIRTVRRTTKHTIPMDELKGDYVIRMRVPKNTNSSSNPWKIDPRQPASISAYTPTPTYIRSEVRFVWVFSHTCTHIRIYVGTISTDRLCPTVVRPRSLTLLSLHGNCHPTVDSLIGAQSCTQSHTRTHMHTVANTYNLSEIQEKMYPPPLNGEPPVQCTDKTNSKLEYFQF